MNLLIVVVKEFLTYVVAFDLSKAIKAQPDRSKIAKSVAVRAKTEDVFDFVRAVVRLAEWADMVAFGIGCSIGQK